MEVDTAAGTVRRVQCIGSPPEPRAYHAFVACGSFCYCVAGAAGGVAHCSECTVMLRQCMAEGCMNLALVVEP